MKKIIILITLTISFGYSFSLFGETKEEKLEKQKEIINTVGETIIQSFKGAGEITSSYIDDYKKEKREKEQKIIDAREREKAKKEMFSQMNNEGNKSKKYKESKNMIMIVEKKD